MTLLVVVGPTASGKTELAIRLARFVGGEIVNADSVQLYRHFDIGSGKPSPEQLASVSHHLVGAVDPLAPMDAARWSVLAEAAIAAIRKRGRVPIICGGTFLYVKALLYGLAPAPPADEAVRAKHREIAEARGRLALHELLAEIDPESATRLDANDFVRVSRALEVHEISGITMSAWQRQHGFRERRHDAELVGLKWPTAQLDARIRVRVESMLEAGWVEEVRNLFAIGYGSARAMSAVGYRQVAEVVSAGVSVDRDRLVETIWRATRIFARRQRTWLRAQSVRWGDLDASSADWERWCSARFAKAEGGVTDSAGASAALRGAPTSTSSARRS